MLIVQLTSLNAFDESSTKCLLRWKKEGDHLAEVPYYKFQIVPLARSILLTFAISMKLLLLSV